MSNKDRKVSIINELENTQSDDLQFIISSYSEIIKKELGTDIGVNFFPANELLVDKYESIKGILIYRNNISKDRIEFKTTFYNDFSFNEKNIITDIGICTINYKKETFKFIKIVTPFTREPAYDFIISNVKHSEKIIRVLEAKRREKFKDDKTEIFGIDAEKIKNDTINFLLNEEFKTFCKSKHIKLKRGIVLEGEPGTGKTLTIKYLKNFALENNIEFKVFSDPEDFLQNKNEYYSNNKKIFIFEDFDSFIRERKDTDNSPNQILSSILNILDGPYEINNTVSIFTTNKLNYFDSAFIRPGRIDKVYSYKLPDKEQIENMLKKYIIEEKEHINYMTDYLLEKDKISFAILKGICDDVNIYKFSNNKESLTKEEITSIMKEKCKSSQKERASDEDKNYEEQIL